MRSWVILDNIFIDQLAALFLGFEYMITFELCKYRSCFSYARMVGEQSPSIDFQSGIFAWRVLNFRHLPMVFCVLNFREYQFISAISVQILFIALCQYFTNVVHFDLCGCTPVKTLRQTTDHSIELFLRVATTRFS